MACSSRFTESAKKLRSNSIPTKRRWVFIAATPVVELPAKGSIIKSFSSVAYRMNDMMSSANPKRSIGFQQGVTTKRD